MLCLLEEDRVGVFVVSGYLREACRREDVLVGPGAGMFACGGGGGEGERVGGGVAERFEEKVAHEREVEFHADGGELVGHP